ncbi:MAG TPA: LacI family DNA-binding transcriptional regulator [Roseimicrobium sp.]|nr:LacI family DNA-binding transcriptional regulator [Roseimicrobium sp.]
MKRVTLRDIAEAVGVTPMTVSRALRNQPRISEAMRKKIQAKAVELGYQPDPALTALVHYRHSRMETPVRASLAWLNRWPDPKQLRRFREFDLYWLGAKAAAERLGFHLEEFIVNDEMTPERLAQILYTRNVRGILIPPGPFHEGWIERFPWEQFSVAAIGITSDKLPIHTITSDQTSNSMLAYKKIQEQGYTRIGFVGAPWAPWTSGAGFLWTQALGTPVELRVPPLLFDHKATDDSCALFKQWMKAHKPDAILTDNPGLPGIMAKLGLDIPQNLGLAATTVLDCPIDAGIYQYPEEIGRVGVLLLHSLINDNDRGIPAISRRVLIEGKWVDGKSLPQRIHA